MNSELPAVIECWKQKGVWATTREGRCEKLAEVIHCRNCAVFIQAGRNLLERELPEGYTAEWTQVLAQKKAEKPLGTLSVLIFRVAQEWLALPAQLFAEITDISPAHSIPHRRNPVLIGMVNVHGEVQLCVSLRALLGIESVAKDSEHERRAYKRMIVLDDNGSRWACPVDEIHGIQRVESAIIENAPVTVSKSETGFSRGIFLWEQRRVALLDAEQVLQRLSRSVQ